MKIDSTTHGKITIKLGTQSGVYFLKIKGEIIYIGQSDNVLGRVFGTEHMCKRFDEVEIHLMPGNEINAYERQQILIHKPKLNMEGLKPRFNRFRRQPRP